MNIEKVRILEIAHARHPDDDDAFRRCAEWMAGFSGVHVTFKPTVDHIVQATAKRFDMEPDVLYGDARAQRIVIPRHLVCHVAHECFGHGLAHIGRELGGRDHTTILHALRTVQVHAERDRTYPDHIQHIADRAMEISVAEANARFGERAA